MSVLGILVHPHHLIDGVLSMEIAVGIVVGRDLLPVTRQILLVLGILIRSHLIDTLEIVEGVDRGQTVKERDKKKTYPMFFFFWLQDLARKYSKIFSSVKKKSSEFFFIDVENFEGRKKKWKFNKEADPLKTFQC